MHLDSDPRIVIDVLTSRQTDRLAEDVRAGLTADPKVLQPKYFYDELGSRLFEAICHLPEYYVYRAERELLENHGAEIADVQAERVRVVELGSGSSEKTPLLLAPLLERRPQVEYVPIDISASALEQGCARLVKAFPPDAAPGLRIRGYVADYQTALRRLVRDARGEGVSTVVLFLGSTIGNMLPDEAARLLADVRRLLRAGDALIVGADLRKPASVLVAAYDDALGVTAAFNLNLLVRINRRLGADFRLADFVHQARWNESLGRIEMHIVSRRRQRVRIPALELEVEFAAGESILSECSYKYDRRQLADLALRTGFRLDHWWTDSEGRFSANRLLAE